MRIPFLSLSLIHLASFRSCSSALLGSSHLKPSCLRSTAFLSPKAFQPRHSVLISSASKPLSLRHPALRAGRGLASLPRAWTTFGALQMGSPVPLPTTYFRATWISEDAGTEGVKGIVWDIDGTLADSKKLAFDATNEVLKKNGYDVVTPEQYAEGSRYPTPLRFSHHSKLSQDSPDFIPVGVKLGAEFDNLYIGLVSPETAGFYDGLVELLKTLSTKYKLGVLTNAAVEYAHAVVSTNGVQDLFKAVHGADDVPAAKPKPDGLLLCCQELGVDPKHVVYIGDSPTDGAAAKAAGCCSIAVTWGANSAPALGNTSDIMCSSVAQLEEALTGFKGSSPAVHMLLDRDGVINFDVGYPGAVEVKQMELLPNVLEALQRMKKLGWRVSLVTNQTAIVKGLSSRSNLMAIHEKMMTLLGEDLIDDCFVSTGEPNDDKLLNFDVKPSADVVAQAIITASSQNTKTVMVGDKTSDLVSGLRAGASELHLVTSSHHGNHSLEILQSQDIDAMLGDSSLKGISKAELVEVIKRTKIHDDLFALMEHLEKEIASQ